jgi:glutamate synthase domain-containing protein 2
MRGCAKFDPSEDVMSPLLLPLTPRFIALTLAILSTVGFAVGLAFDQQSIVLAICFSVALFLTVVGTNDLFQKSHSVLRNYPILAHFRFIFEAIRPEMRQYFFEGDKDGMPFSRDRRAVAYQRAKKALDVRPFGTHYDVYSDGYEWMTHSIAPRPVAKEPVPDHDRRQGLHPALLGLGAQYLGHELRVAQRQRHPGAEWRRQEG